MRLKDKQRIKSGYYRKKRARAYKQSGFINVILGLVFIAGGIFNTGSPVGTLFMFIVGGLMIWCGFMDFKGQPKRKTSAFSEASWKRTNQSRKKAGLAEFKRPEDIPEPLNNQQHIKPFPIRTLVILIILIVAVLIFHQVKINPYIQTNTEKRPRQTGLT